MKKITQFQISFFLIFAILLGTWSCDLKSLEGIIDSTSGTLTSEQVANGLKQALEKGAQSGAKALSTENGYFKSPYKIFLPEEAQEVVNKLQAIPGFNQFEDEVILKINRAAEDAAKAAAPIFISAIKQMTIQDAWNILTGADNAATNYLKKTTSSQLYNSFQPKIKTSLNKFGAIDLWEKGITKYNALPFVKKINPRLDDYVTNQALKGLFSEVAKKEKDIRENPIERTTDLLRKVFAQQDK